jgi:hypothetical protein
VGANVRFHSGCGCKAHSGRAERVSGQVRGVLSAFAMHSGFGKRRWAIAEGYIPRWSTGPQPEMTSHETICLLNCSDADAHVEITLVFANREPAGPYQVLVPARRIRHVRFNELLDPEPVPRGLDYASFIDSDVPIVVQHTRLDSRQPENALLSTIAYSE